MISHAFSIRAGAGRIARLSRISFECMQASYPLLRAANVAEARGDAGAHVIDLSITELPRGQAKKLRTPCSCIKLFRATWRHRQTTTSIRSDTVELLRPSNVTSETSLTSIANEKPSIRSTETREMPDQRREEVLRVKGTRSWLMQDHAADCQGELDAHDVLALSGLRSPKNPDDARPRSFAGPLGS